MNMFYLTVSSYLAKTEMNFAERSFYALRVLFIGMLMVFSVLAILWGVLTLSKMFFYDKQKKKATEAEALSKDVKQANGDLTSSSNETMDNQILVAVITAAIAASMEENGEVGNSSRGFRVVSFRRAQGQAWNRH